MRFLTEPVPERGVALDVLPGVRRIVADNPGPMTYHGTNTWLIETADGIAVLDPGPDAPAHVAAILAAAGGRIAHILVSHTHRDHFGAAAALEAATRAPTYGYRASGNPGFTPDRPLDDGDAVGGLTAMHTPGHAADHLCFAMPGGVLFTGDHVMPWSTSVVIPPGGDMRAYLASLGLLLDRDDQIYLSGHGPKFDNPLPYVRALLAHRIAREQEIAAALGHRPAGTEQLVERVYPNLDARLRRPAERNVLAHLLKLEAEGRVFRDGDRWRSAGSSGA
jgi:glyoxylase-like metal-dependent hydrolase (beta-lactamase superfamily II)